MNVNVRKRKRQSGSIAGRVLYETSKKRNILYSSSEDAYSRRISFYTQPPLQDITIEEFESFAIDRLKVLKEIDNLKVRGAKFEAIKARMINVLGKYLPIPRESSMENAEEAIRKDVISHFTLRLAYCRPNDRAWFLQQERELLKIRLELDEGALDTFISDNGLDFPHMSHDEFSDLESDLFLLNQSLGNNEKPSPEHYYKVPFEEALDLVHTRRVLLRNGDAYVHKNALISLVLTEYKKHLSLQLARAYKQLPFFSKDHRVSDLIESLPTQYLGRAYETSDREIGSISLESLDKLAQESYPLCMKRLHLSLKRDHHLKHGGRMQYGLFIKGIGLSLEQSLAFWREEFIQAGKDFEKDYAYNVRHNYGMVGKRTSYSPYACDKIIEQSAGEGEYHGCAYKQLDRNILQRELSNYPEHMQMTPNEIQKVLKLTEEGNFQEACRSVFEFTHRGAQPHAQTHPNKFFDKSREYLENKAAFEQAAAEADSEKTVVPVKE